MALTAFCPTCQRTVYIQEEQTPVCPVCSSPLLDTQSPPDEQEDEKSGEEHSPTK